MAAEKQRVPILLGKISKERQISLAQLTFMPGWEVLIDIIETACREASDAVNRLNPTIPENKARLDGMQMVSYSKNSFAQDIRDSINYHCSDVVLTAHEETLEAKHEDSAPVARFKVPVAPKR